MIEEKRKMDPPIKSENERVWVAENDDIYGTSCSTMAYKSF
jgi:hypothetical protein